MDMEQLNKLIRIVERSAVYITPACDEGIRIDYQDTLADLDEDFCGPQDLKFYGTGEETGNGYEIHYCEVNLDGDKFYELTLVDTNSV